MKKRLTLWAFVLLIIGLGCGNPAERQAAITHKRIPVVLKRSDIFKGNLVNAYLENELKFTQEGNTLFLKGVNAYRNKKDLDSADYYFRQAIVKEPSARAYFELGNLCMDRKDFETAMKAYGLAEQLDYQPFSQILYNKACVYSLQSDTELAAKYLEYAIQAGYMNLDHLEKDPDLESLRDTYHFKKAIDKGLRGISNSENLFWLQFVKKFPKLDLPHTPEMTREAKDLKELEFISYDYEKYITEMRDEKFSREVSKGFYYYAQLAETEKYRALVYVVKDEFMGEFAPLTYRLVTYTPDGKIIDKKDIGGRSDLDSPLKIPTIRKGNYIELTLKEVLYEKNPDEHGYYENPVKSTKQIGKSSVRISQNGKISEEPITLAAR